MVIQCQPKPMFFLLINLCRYYYARLYIFNFPVNLTAGVKFTTELEYVS